MAWITDVAPQTTIRSVWGNSVRDCIVHQFADLTEANAHALPNGTHAAIAGVPYLRKAGVWTLLRPTVVWSNNVGNGTTTGNIAKDAATFAIPAGYGTPGAVNIAWSGTFSWPGTPAVILYVKLYNGAGTLLASRNLTLPTNYWGTVSIHGSYAPNNAGETAKIQYLCDFIPPYLVSLAEGSGTATCVP